MHTFAVILAPQKPALECNWYTLLITICLLQFPCHIPANKEMVISKAYQLEPANKEKKR